MVKEARTLSVDNMNAEPHPVFDLLLLCELTLQV